MFIMSIVVKLFTLSTTHNVPCLCKITPNPHPENFYLEAFEQGWTKELTLTQHLYFFFPILQTL